MKQFSFFASLILLLVFSCKKDTPNPVGNYNGVFLGSCSPNTGFFEISIDGVNHVANFVQGDQFSIIYNYFGDSITNYGVYSTDQDGKYLYFGLAYPGKMQNGTNTVGENTSIDFGLDIGLDTNSLYMSEVTFNVSTSVFNPVFGVYEPIIGTFHGLAHKYPIFGGVAPTDTFAVEGSFCLNGLILP